MTRRAGMLPSVRPPDRDDSRLLLEILSHPEAGERLTPAQWDLLVRSARACELLGVLHARIGGQAWAANLPPGPARHLLGAHHLCLHRQAMARYLLSAVETTLADAGVPLVLLKGVAYVAEDLPMSAGRMFDDVDIMVPRQDLDRVERLLATAGWVSEKPDAYDQHYYRAWSHELPPMRHENHALQLDVHHTILPPTGRARVGTDGLFARARPLPGTPWQVLAPEDQVIHVAAHLFQDSDCHGRFRELVDFDGLVRHHAREAGFWDRCAERAQAQGLGEALWLALRYAHAWLGTPAPDPALAAMQAARPAAALDRAIRRTIFPVHPDGHPRDARGLARTLLGARALWLRMPPGLIAYHASMKLLRSLTRKRPPPSP